MKYGNKMLVLTIIIFIAVSVYILSTLDYAVTTFSTFDDNISTSADYVKSNSFILPQEKYSNTIENTTIIKTLSYTFQNNSRYVINRFIFNEENNENFEYKIPLTGNEITIKYQDFKQEKIQWNEIGDFTEFNQRAVKATLFIETDTQSAVVSIPAVYKDLGYNTLECLPEYENPVEIIKTEKGFEIKAVYKKSNKHFGELWYVTSSEKLFSWNKNNLNLWSTQDLHENRRWSFDGYYFKTYKTYEPYSENSYFRNPANFTGAQLVNSFDCLGNDILGYVTTKVSLKNQNSQGYFETAPKSYWLFDDYNIGHNFYDTRFNSDFGINLIYAYRKYKDQEFLDSAVKYATFLINYSENNAYVVESNADNSNNNETSKNGMLLPDYWHPQTHKKTHVSLNHQLSEINFLLEIYITTTDIKYYDLSMKLLNGIKNTIYEWILPDNNLKYAIYYDETSNEMKDYPYLTYNDLFETKRLLNIIISDTTEIEMLMSSKKIWMDNNGIYEYKKFTEN